MVLSRLKVEAIIVSVVVSCSVGVVVDMVGANVTLDPPPVATTFFFLMTRFLIRGSTVPSC